VIRFAGLFAAIDRTNSTNAKVEAMVQYFATAPPHDAAWAVFFLTGRRLKRLVHGMAVGQWALTATGLSEWLLGESYAVVGDGAETAALILDQLPSLPSEDTSLAEWRRTLDVNLTSAFLCCRAAIPPMRRQNAGRIVNLASIAGKEGNASMTPYSAAKVGVIALTKALGKELAETEVRVNCVAPAVIATDLVKQMAPETYEAVVAKIPLGRPGRAEEVAALVAWLASEECSFSTGACFDLSGGRATY